jgi:RNA polymerase sigma-70 factor, ECF subfamily
VSSPKGASHELRDADPPPACNIYPSNPLIGSDEAVSVSKPSDDARIAEWDRVHGPPVRAFLLARVRRADVADDLKQEVFCRAWKARDNYREQGTSLAYLLKIADRLACDWGRRTGPARNLDDEAWKRHEPVCSAPGPPDEATGGERTRQLAEALGHLSEVQQRVLLLRYYGQMTFAEIAEATGCPLNTALSHCHRGLEALRRILVDSII